jgi:hypothetical protein
MSSAVTEQGELMKPLLKLSMEDLQKGEKYTKDDNKDLLVNLKKIQEKIEITSNKAQEIAEKVLSEIENLHKMELKSKDGTVTNIK